LAQGRGAPRIRSSPVKAPASRAAEIASGMGCTPEALAFFVIGASLLAAIAGHWSLRTAVPVLDAAAAVRAACVSASQAELTLAAASDEFAGERFSARILSRGARHWHGRAQAAPLHEALGRVHLRDGDHGRALEEFHRAAESSEAVAAEALGPLVSAAGLRARVQEAELLLHIGELEAAVEAVGSTLMTEVRGTASIRARSLKVLVATTLGMLSSDEEAEMISSLFDKVSGDIREQLTRRDSDFEASAALSETSASLRAVRGDVETAVAALQEAVAQREGAVHTGAALRRNVGAGEGGSAEAFQLAAAHLRLTRLLSQGCTGGAGSLKEARAVEEHAWKSLELLWPGPPGSGARCASGYVPHPAVERLRLSGEALELLALGALDRRSWGSALSTAECALAIADSAATGGQKLWSDSVKTRAQALGSEALWNLGRGDEAISRSWATWESARTLLGRGRGLKALWPSGLDATLVVQSPEQSAASSIPDGQPIE